MNLELWRHYLAARVLEVLGRKEQAVVQYRAALAFNPHFARALNSIGFILASQSHFAAAAEHFERALADALPDGYAHFNLGFVREKLGSHRAAIEAFREAVRLRPTLDRAWYGMGMAHAALGEHKEAAQALREAATLQPMNAHAWYALGMAYHHSREPDQVKQVVEHLFRFDPLMTRRLIHDAARSDLAHLVKDLVV